VVLGLQHQVPPADDTAGDQSRTQSVLVPLSGATGSTAGGASAVRSSVTPSSVQRPPSAARRVEAALQAAIREQRGPAALEESYLSAAALLALSTEDEPEEGGDEQAGLQGYVRGGLQLAGGLYGSDSYADGTGSYAGELVAEAERGAAVFGTGIATAGGAGGPGSMTAAQRRQDIGLVSYGPSRQWGATEEGRIALRLVHALCTLPLQR
jgi:hypothetical protein